MSAQAELVKMSAVSKTFGSVQALSEVDFTVCTGEIVGLVGDNGAGKSTLIQILSGVIRPDSGTIYVRGNKATIRHTSDAIALGIETIYQGAALVNQLTVARNLFLGREPTKRLARLVPKLDSHYMEEESRILLRRMGLGRDVNPRQRIAQLSGGERQSISIARAMYFQADLIILDEPTNNLGVEETRRVLEFIREAKTAGRASIFITHNLFHVLQVADRIVVLRRGRKVGDLVASETTLEQVEGVIMGLHPIA